MLQERDVGNDHVQRGYFLIMENTILCCLRRDRVELIKSSEMKNAFRNLFNIYAHELSKYNPWLGTQINSDGNYLSEYVEQTFNDTSIESFCIVKDERPIGFAMFSNSDSSEGNVSIDELFLVETSRGLGISEEICKSFWSENKGICSLHVLKANLPAVTYWEKLIKKCGYAYEKRDDHEQMWCYEISLDSSTL